jgi:hypothetical protein
LGFDQPTWRVKQQNACLTSKSWDLAHKNDETIGYDRGIMGVIGPERGHTQNCYFNETMIS